MNNAIELKKLCLNYKDRTILQDVNWKIKKGSIVGIVGLSGAGKTSLMRIINGNIEHDANVAMSGEVLVFGNEADREQPSDIATVYQDPDFQIVFPNVLDEITFGMENLCFSKDKMDKRLKDITTQFAIEHLLDRNPNNLSGGEKQLVVLASILCIDSKILLLDECTSQVDDEGRKRVKKSLSDLRDKGITIILVEHNFDNLDIADEIYELKNANLQKHGVKEGIL